MELQRTKDDAWRMSMKGELLS